MTDDLPGRHQATERIRQLEQRLASLLSRSGADTQQIEDDNGVLRYEAGELSDGTYGIRVYDSNGSVIWSAP